MKLTINVVLPADRRKLATYTIVDNSGVYVGAAVKFGPVPCLGLADTTLAAEHNNPSRNPLLPYGDTPTGLYRVTIIPASSNTRSYGPNRRLMLTPFLGQCVIAEDHEHLRAGILNHGGDPNPAYTFWDSLRPTEGCVRISNENMAAALLVLDTASEIWENITQAA
jgi:hypothetical protein